MALRKPKPSNGGRRPVKSVVAYLLALDLLLGGLTLGKFSAGRTDAEEEAWSLTLRISRGDPITRPAIPET